MATESQPLLGRTVPKRRIALSLALSLALCAALGWQLTQGEATQGERDIQFCSRHKSCEICAYSTGCRWCPNDNACYVRFNWNNPCGTFSGSISDPDDCPAREGENIGYDDEIGRLMWKYSNGAYCVGGDLRCSGTEGFKVDGVMEEGESDGYAYVGHDDDRQQIVVAFRGATEKKDMDAETSPKFFNSTCKLYTNDRHDFHIHPEVCSYYTGLNKGGVDSSNTHSPFKKLVERVAAKYSDYKIIFTGHSLGGSVAAVQALTFALDGGRKPTLFTFGQPRTGDHSFATRVDKHVDSYRVVHGADKIVHRPFCCGQHLQLWQDNYQCQKDEACPYHSGNEVWYFHDMSRSSHWEVCSEGEDPRCSNGMVSGGYDKDVNSQYFDIPIGDCCT